MANALYGKGREAFANGEIDWLADTIQVVPIDTALYTVNIDVDEFFDDIPVGARVGAPVTLASKTNTLGVLDAADAGITGLVAAPSIEACVVLQSTGVEATSRLIAYIDTATGLPVSAGATAANILWDNGPNKILKL